MDLGEQLAHKACNLKAEEQKNALQRELEDDEDEIQHCLAQINALKREKSDLQATVDAKSEQFLQLERLVEDEAERSRKLTVRISESEKDLASQRDELERRTAAAHSLKVKLKEQTLETEIYHGKSRYCNNANDAIPISSSCLVLTSSISLASNCFIPVNRWLQHAATSISRRLSMSSPSPSPT